MTDGSAGYSKTPLLEKLGIKEGTRVAILGAPHEYLRKLGELPEGVLIATSSRRPSDFMQFFATNRRQLESEVPKLKKKLSQLGMLWICWPKRSSGFKTDLSGNAVRKIGLDNGLVDVKIAAIDETWSGLKFVRRVGDRVHGQ
jgi:hypothetical protein